MNNEIKEVVEEDLNKDPISGSEDCEGFNEEEI